MAGPSTRADDERLLWLLAARGAAAGFGLTAEAVRTATNRVRDADLRESGGEADQETIRGIVSPPNVDLVAGCYQWGA